MFKKHAPDLKIRSNPVLKETPDPQPTKPEDIDETSEGQTGPVDTEFPEDQPRSAATDRLQSNVKNQSRPPSFQPKITIAGTDAPVEYAGFARRAFALVLDQIFIIATEWFFLSPAFLAILYSEYIGWALTCVIAISVAVMHYWIYTAFFEHSKWQATPGKFLVGLRVTDLKGEQLSFWRSSLRLLIQYLVLFVLTVGLIFLNGVAIGYCNAKWKTNLPVDQGAISYIFALYFGYCFVLFTKKKQTLFDKAARRVVVFQPGYANSQQMTVFECFKSSFFRLPQQAKLFFSHFQINTKFERIKMSAASAICFLCCGWSVFALTQVTQSLVAVETAIKAATTDKEMPKTTIKKMDYVYYAIESLAHNLNLRILEREIQDRALLYNHNSTKIIERVNRDLDDSQIALAEKDLQALSHRFSLFLGPNSSELSTRARLAQMKGDLQTARDLSINALKWNPYNRQASKILNAIDSAYGKPLLKLNDVRHISSIDPVFVKKDREPEFENIFSDASQDLLAKKVRECDEILAIMPDCTKVLMTKAKVLQYQKKTSEAEVWYRKAIASTPEDREPITEYVDFLSDSDYNEPKSAIGKLRELSSAKNLAYIHEKLADRLEGEAISIEDEKEEKKVREVAIAEWDKAIKLEPYRIKYHVEKGHLLTYIDKNQEAIEEFKAALALDFEREASFDIVPISEIDVRRNLAEAYGNAGLINLAEKEFSRVIAKEPNNYYTYRSRANLLKERKRYAEAIQDYSRAISLKRGVTQKARNFMWDATMKLVSRVSKAENKFDFDEINNAETADMLSERGHAYEELGKYTDALADFQESLLLNDKYESDDVAHLCCRIGMPQKAIDIYTAAIAKKTNRSHLHMVKAVLLQDQGKAAEAMKEQQLCIASAEKDVSADASATNYYALAQLYMVFNDYPKAESAINQSLKQEVDDPTYKITLAKILAAQKKFSNAQKVADTVSISDCSCNIIDKAEVLQACGNYKQSLVLLNKSLKEGNETAQEHYLRSLAYKHLGSPDKAAADLKKANQLGYDKDPLLRLPI